MNYYNQIKNELINNEIVQKVKDYSKNKSDLTTRYNVGKLLFEAGKHYGESIIKQYSTKLKEEVDKKYDATTLKRMRQFYLLIEKGAPLVHQLNWTHYIQLLSFDINKTKFYINETIKYNLSKRELREKIKSKEYERLPEETKLKLINQEKFEIQDFVKNPIIIKNKLDIETISEKALKSPILEDIDNFLKQLGDGFSYIGNEYKIKIGNTYNILIYYFIILNTMLMLLLNLK